MGLFKKNKRKGVETFPHKTIYDNIAYGLRMKKVPKDEIRQRVGEMMKIWY